MHVAECVSCPGNCFRECAIAPEVYPVSAYYLQVAVQRLPLPASSLILQALHEIESLYKGKVRESGVPSLEHPTEVALLLCGEWIPDALRPSSKARQWICFSFQEKRSWQLQVLSQLMGLDADDNFARYFSLVQFRSLSRIGASLASRSLLAHLLALLHDRIEDDPRVLDGSVSPDDLISEVVSAYSSYGVELGEALRSISYLKKGGLGGCKYSKQGYISVMYFTSPLALFIKAFDVLSNAFTIGELKDRVTPHGLMEAADRQRAKISEYYWYVNLLIDLGHPVADFLADVLYARSSPQEFGEWYSLYSAESALYYHHIDELFTSVLQVVGERGLCRLDLGGVYRALRRFRRGFYEQNRQAALAPRIVIHAHSAEDKDALVQSLDSSSLKAVFPSAVRVHEHAGYTEMFISADGGHGLLLVVTEPESAWKFAALEDSLFSTHPAHRYNYKLLQEYLRASALSLPTDPDQALLRLRSEPIRDLIRVKVFVGQGNYDVFLPQDSCGLDFYLRLCLLLKQQGVDVDVFRFRATFSSSGQQLSLDDAVPHNSEFIVSLDTVDGHALPSEALWNILSFLYSSGRIRTLEGVRWADNYLQGGVACIPPRRLVA